jgi:hypothetical protein
MGAAPDKRVIIIANVVFLLLFLFGSVQVGSRYQDCGSGQDTPALDEQIIEGVRQFEPSDGDDYVDSFYSKTYGTHSNDPPNGMGEDNSDHTTLTEESYTSSTWTNLMMHATFSGTPADWTASEISYSDGYFKENGQNYGEIYCTPVDTTSCNQIRFTLNIECSWDLGSVDVSFWDGSAWDYIGSFNESSEGDQDLTSSASEYKHSSFQVKVSYLDTDGMTDFKANNWRIDKQTSSTNYGFDAVYKFTGVDSGTYYVEELYVDFSGESSSDALEFRFASGDTTPETVVKNSAPGNVDFHVNIHSYLTGSECYVRIIDDDGRLGDSESTWTIDRLYILLTNTVPENAAAPTCSNLDDSEFLLAEAKYYQITTYHSDLDGRGTIDHVYLDCYSNDRGTRYWSLTYDGSFSEAYDGGDYVTFDTGSSSADGTGTDLELTFYVRISWGHPNVTDMDLVCGVSDLDGESDSDFFEVNWDIEARLDISGPALSDLGGTPNRGNINESISTSGEVFYYGTSVHPDDASVDVYISCANVSSSPWAATNYNGSTGGFSTTVEADNEVGLDVYSFQVVEEGAGPAGTSLLHSSRTSTYVTDRITCVSLESPSFIVDSTATGYMHVRLRYQFDDTDVTDGSYLIGDRTLSHFSEDEWRASHTPDTLTSVLYDSITVDSADVHGLASVDMNGLSLTMYWDQLICSISGPAESPILPGENASGITTWAKYYFSSQHPLYNSYVGTLHTNDTDFAYETPGTRGYTVSSADGDDLWGVFTIYSSNSTSCTWEYPAAAPTWLEIPEDQSAEFLLPFRYDVNATIPGNLSLWWVNDTARFSIDQNGVITNGTHLPIGMFPLHIYVNDTWGQRIDSAIQVIVQDTLPPAWVSNPEDQTIELGDDLNYDLDAYDLSGIAGWWISDMENFSIDSSGTLRNEVDLIVGNYSLLVRVIDSHDRKLNATIRITVQDTTPPIWSSTPQNQTIASGTPLSYQLVASDLSPIVQWTINDTENFHIDSSGRLTDTKNLPSGTYGLEISVSDQYGNVLTTVLKITIRPIDSGPDPWWLFAIGSLSVGTAVVVIFMMIRIKKIVEARSAPAGATKEDLDSALDYLDMIQEENGTEGEEAQ